jgi:hypothetical protein
MIDTDVERADPALLLRRPRGAIDRLLLPDAADLK